MNDLGITEYELSLIYSSPPEIDDVTLKIY